MQAVVATRHGHYWISSKFDPRWSAEGSCRVDDDATPMEVEKELELLGKVFGEPPEDLRIAWMSK